jgi:hypothetical protein
MQVPLLGWIAAQLYEGERLGGATNGAVGGAG